MRQELTLPHVLNHATLLRIIEVIAFKRAVSGLGLFS
jgi:hypothetical protein